jgi:NADPH:quinone reductase-like Zn-dependent oxidoreductase
MKAATQERYGVEAIEVADRPIPEPGPGQIRVRIESASLNPSDWYFASGKPAFIRLMSGLRRPKSEVIGSDGAGVVDTIGPDVAGFAIGDRVFGVFGGAFAEHAVAKVDRVAHIPDGVDVDTAAGLPIAGVTALQAIERGQVAGRRVVVNGASGGVGHYAVQIAVAYGAGEVVGVCSGPNVELVRSLGAAEVVDYNAGDFTDTPADVLIDCAGNRSVADVARMLRPGGTWIGVGSVDKGGPILGMLPAMLGRTISTRLRRINMQNFVAAETAERLTELARLTADGSIRTVIDTDYRLDEIAKAFAHLETNRTTGKIIIRP